MGARVLRGGVRASERPLSRPPRPGRCREFARKELAAALPVIMQRFVEEAQKGSIAHVKALLTLAGLDKEVAVSEGKSGRPKSLSDLLLRELRKGPPAVKQG